jgi:NTP pyrophosphatase (non-canonical NTP hydrolase)
MKQIILIMLILSQILIFAGCNDETDALKLNSVEETDTLIQQNTSDISEDKPSTQSKEPDSQATIDSGLFEIVAESGNSISSQDKEKVIKKLEDELGTLFNSINTLEEN